MKTMPKVAIIIPHYNQSLFIGEAVSSVLGQQYGDWECIIIDDGSLPVEVERAQQIVNNFADPRLRWIAQPYNLGVIPTRLEGVKQSTAPYLVFLDGDDALMPRFLSETVPLLDQNERVAYVYTQLQYFGARHDIFISQPFNGRNLLFENFVSVTSLTRRSAFLEIGGFNMNLNRVGLEDWDLFLSMYEHGLRGSFLAKPLVRYRQDAEGKNRNQPSKVRSAEEIIKRNHPKLFGLTYYLLAKWRTLRWILRNKRQ